MGQADYAGHVGRSANDTTGVTSCDGVRPAPSGTMAAQLLEQLQASSLAGKIAVCEQAGAAKPQVLRAGIQCLPQQTSGAVQLRRTASR